MAGVSEPEGAHVGQVQEERSELGILEPNPVPQILPPYVEASTDDVRALTKQIVRTAMAEVAEQEAERLVACADGEEVQDDFDVALQRHAETAAAIQQLVPQPPPDKPFSTAAPTQSRGPGSLEVEGAATEATVPGQEPPVAAQQLVPQPPPDKPSSTAVPTQSRFVGSLEAEGAATEATVPGQEHSTPVDPVDDLFSKADLNSDGILDYDDISRLLIRLRALATESAEDNAWLAPSEAEIVAAMWAMDTDRSGTVSFEEFREWFVHQGGLEYAEDPALWEPDEAAQPPEHAYKRSAAMLTPARNATDEQLASFYRQLDLDGNNELNVSEVGKLLTKLRASGTGCRDNEEWLEPSDQELRSAMKVMDTDGNGTVSQAEFSNWFTKRGGWDYASSPFMWTNDDDDDDDDGEVDNDEERAQYRTPKKVKPNVERSIWKQEESENTDASVAALFHAHDSSGDGVLDRAEICDLLLALRQRAINEGLDAADTCENEWAQPTDEEVSAAMTTMDVDGDGLVTLSEFSSWWEQMGGWDYAEDPGMWGVPDADYGDPAEPPLPGMISATSPAPRAHNATPANKPAAPRGYGHRPGTGMNGTNGNAQGVQVKVEEGTHQSAEEAQLVTQELVDRMVASSEDATEQAHAMRALGAIAYHHRQRSWALSAGAVPNIIGAMLLHQRVEEVQYEGCAVLYGLCIYTEGETRENGQITNGSDSGSDDIYEVMQETARHEGAVAVLKAARMRFSQNADLQIYAYELLSALGQQNPMPGVVTSVTSVCNEDLKDAAVGHAKRMASLEEQTKYLHCRIHARGIEGVRQKDDEDRSAGLVQQQFTAVAAADALERRLCELEIGLAEATMVLEKMDSTDERSKLRSFSSKDHEHARQSPCQAMCTLM